MTQWSAGMKITAGRLNDHTPLYYYSGLTAATNFEDSGTFIQIVSGIAFFNITLTYTGATSITPTTNGNLSPDVLAATLDEQYRPLAKFWTQFGNGATSGGTATVDVDGSITLTATNNENTNITTSNPLQFYFEIPVGS